MHPSDERVNSMFSNEMLAREPSSSLRSNYMGNPGDGDSDGDGCIR